MARTPPCRTRRTGVIAVLLLAPLTGLPPLAGDEPTPPATSEKPDLPPDPVFIELARQIAQAACAGDEATVNTLVDTDALMATAIGKLECTAEIRDEFRRHASLITLGAIVCGVTRTGGRFDFVRLHTEGAQTRALCRLLRAEGRLEYVDLCLSGSGEAARVTDAFLFSSGEMLSRIWARHVMRLVQAERTLDPLKGWDRELADTLTAIAEAEELAALDKGPDALAALDELPANLRKDRTVLLLSALYAAPIGGKVHQDALDAWTAAYPEDPCLDLSLIGQHMIRQKYDKVLETVRHLDRGIGGDPYLHFVRAQAHWMAGRAADAKTAADAAVAGDKTLPQPHELRLEIALQENDFAEIARRLLILEREFGAAAVDRTESEEYAEFVKSAEYKKWKKARGG